jgi:hypothetical protein
VKRHVKLLKDDVTFCRAVVMNDFLEEHTLVFAATPGVCVCVCARARVCERERERKREREREKERESINDMICGRAL